MLKGLVKAAVSASRWTIFGLMVWKTPFYICAACSCYSRQDWNNFNTFLAVSLAGIYYIGTFIASDLREALREDDARNRDRNAWAELGATEDEIAALQRQHGYQSA